MRTLRSGFCDELISSVGAFLLGLSQLLLVYIVVKCARGARLPAVWEGAQGLEFTLPSPPPYRL